MYDFPANIGTSRHENDIITALVRLQRIGLPDNPIAFYGSSSFRIWGSIAEDLGSLDIVNLGFGGGTYLSASHYMHQLLVPLKPNRVVLYFGENDIASDGLKAQTSLRHLHDLRDGIYRALPQADVFVVAIKHSPARWIYRHEFDLFNQMSRDWCDSSERTTWLDPNAGLIGENGLPMFRYYLPDLVHLNAAGYAVWSEALRKTLGLHN
ncbi:GDSL-type esterase/lipase family protein [Agrobacterium salinitolerans]|uniref:GDSL-type esterase/lipase family protein n=1 Tax=Agrobacterium salinitolerans TaxID=1183413 RepID=A0A4Z1R4X3_9HYPH|nr:GDSL-type esterase/lipase family protein [Agrobacterium salinitolerans]MCZ7853519.1 GDSL-type esterase/lipase family protein [Agrobacterium salinitolerans]MCZ7862036.1 GDSL-type esterase/lipase family protein [Agrobacterium salinitolerans]MCZ7939781.1 GDSL-type esterase/lipase family protein [Agrobacterium salinitolerans]MCZ7974741.1 GDSL-type esterase/lipase family protein [Agrobacterium salinitolerans]UYZ09903.1 GDSL-type esterase/lipase family protein [Agrobacterium salinitolerans]